MHVHASPKRGLQQVFLLLVVYAMVEIAVGFAVNSLALEGDGWHMLFDAAGVGIALLAALQVERIDDANTRERTEATAACIIALMLLPTAYRLIAGGISRLYHPVMVQAEWMSLTAVIGLGVNLICLRLLRQHARSHLHVRGARFHVLGDFLNSIGVIVGGGVIMITGYVRIDGILAGLIGIFLCMQVGVLGRRALLTIVKPGQEGVG